MLVVCSLHLLLQVDAADNIDLMTIVQEFVDYYHSKFGRYPKLIRHNFPPPVAYQVRRQNSGWHTYIAAQHLVTQTPEHCRMLGTIVVTRQATSTAQRRH